MFIGQAEDRSDLLGGLRLDDEIRNPADVAERKLVMAIVDHPVRVGDHILPAQDPDAFPEDFFVHRRSYFYQKIRGDTIWQIPVNGSAFLSVLIYIEKTWKNSV
jgi:hypothetical protein